MSVLLEDIYQYSENYLSTYLLQIDPKNYNTLNEKRYMVIHYLLQNNLLIKDLYVNDWYFSEALLKTNSYSDLVNYLNDRKWIIKNIDIIRRDITNVNLLQQFLDKLENYIDTVLTVNSIIEELLGQAVFSEARHSIFKLNAFIEEFNIEIDKMEVLKGIYHANNRKISSESRGDCISFHNFEHQKHNYMHYLNLFN